MKAPTVISIGITAALISSLAHARIDRVTADPQARGDFASFCEGMPALERGKVGIFRVSGPWTDWTNRVTATGNVTGRKTVSNKRPPYVNVELTAPSNATLGRRNVTLSRPGGADRFQVLIMEERRIDALIPNNPGTAFRNATIEIRGRNLPSTMTSRSSLITSGFEPSKKAGGSTGGRITQQRVVRLSSTRARLELQFAESMERAVISVGLRGRDNCYGNLSFDAGSSNVVAGAEPRVALNAQQVDNRNFVSRIFLDAQTRNPQTSGPVTFGLELRRAVAVNLPRNPTVSRTLARGRLSAASRPTGEKIFWRIVPANAFEFNGRPLNSQFRELVVTPGNRQGRITAQITRCPGNSRNSSAVLQTVMHDRNAQSAPERVDYRFSVTCQEQR